jgi:hypothetical protein
MDSSLTQVSRPRNRALRAVFEYKGQEVRLASVQSLEMLAPPPQAIFPRPNERGTWFELRDREGRTLYRRVIDNPIREDIEVITDDPDHPLSRIAAEQREGIFFLLAPDIPQARELVIVTEPARRQDAGSLEAALEPVTYSFDLGNASRKGEN